MHGGNHPQRLSAEVAVVSVMGAFRTGKSDSRYTLIHGSSRCSGERSVKADQVMVKHQESGLLK